ncbi:hypothetical protein DCAR_0626369 [Daucus carota subsp. sativus]|uniref:Pentacotripeptide-repeat region of PRORP domain-containing protein n=1 Tax=Daucus carota subsp. sativus TaxID=79200 RepID=A0A164X124_DAUCS|nr:PREDICTED: pentatricopeptide repeat-containing protein At4g30825, chloroplastic [Daucus carota subsp. sativus]WOH06940.1 hypothetical protein DCAR_0626369 [Daucus carota subsp. sativus]
MAAIKFASLVESNDAQKLSFSGYVHTASVFVVIPFSKLKSIRVSRLDNVELSDPVLEKASKFSSEFKKGKRNIWMRFRSLSKVKELTSDGRNEAKGKNGETGVLLCDKDLSDGGNSLDFFGGDVDRDLSVERCNVMLEGYERISDGKAMEFFRWMRSKGKLKRNVKAYKVALRVLGRRQDWDGAEIMIREMVSESGCELNFQVFNTVIYACNKQGFAEIGGKWFRMMLDMGVRPNVATIGMLMSLYQKGLVVQEAEFTFSQMRNFRIMCQSAYSAMITIYTRLRLHEKAEEVIGLLKEDKVIMNKENWLVLINAYCQQGKLEKAELALISMHDAGFPPHIVAYNTMVTGYGKVFKMEAAQSIFQNLEKVGLKPDETTYRSMIEGWGRMDNYKEAEWYYQELKRLGFSPNSSNLYTMINLQAEHGDKDGAVRTLNEMIAMDCQYPSVLGILIQAYERAGKFDQVPSVVTGLFYEHVLINQTSCSILVMAYVKHRLVSDAVKVLQNKRWKDHIFEDNLYHLLICSCKEFGHLEDAIKLYGSMRNSSKPNLHILSTMIDIYTVMNQFKEAENLYIKLKSSGVALDMIAFSIVVRMYVKSGSLKDACSVLEIIDNRSDIVPDAYLLRDMLRIYQRLDMRDNLSGLYYKILKTGIPLDQEMYNCLINCCARALPVDELTRIFDEMLQHGFEPNTITFNVMLDVYGKCRLFRKVGRIYRLAKRRGLLDVVSYNTIVASYGKGKDLRNMSSTIGKMQFNGFSVSLEAYNCMLDAYGKEGEMEKFKDVLQRMKESCCASDHYTYNIMINIYGEKGWIEEVSDVLAELKESGLGPDLCSYNTLIKAYGIAGMVDEAVSMVKEMRENGIEPDKATYANLVTALRNNDMFLEAVKWSLWMKQMGF